MRGGDELGIHEICVLREMRKADYESIEGKNTATGQ